MLSQENNEWMNFILKERELDSFFSNTSNDIVKERLFAMSKREKAFLFQMYLKKDSYRSFFKDCVGIVEATDILEHQLSPPMTLTDLEKLVTFLIEGE